MSPVHVKGVVVVRQLSGSDVELLKQLLKVFAEAFEDVATYQDAIRLYESLGTREDVHHFDILVDP